MKHTLLRIVKRKRKKYNIQKFRNPFLESLLRRHLPLEVSVVCTEDGLSVQMVLTDGGAGWSG